MIDYDWHNDCPSGVPFTKAMVKLELPPDWRTMSPEQQDVWTKVTCEHCGKVLKPPGTYRIWLNDRPMWATPLLIHH